MVTFDVQKSKFDVPKLPLVNSDDVHHFLEPGFVI